MSMLSVIIPEDRIWKSAQKEKKKTINYYHVHRPSIP